MNVELSDTVEKVIQFQNYIKDSIASFEKSTGLKVEEIIIIRYDNGISELYGVKAKLTV